MTWRDESGSQEVFRALSIDPFGRYLQVRYGNNTREIREFNDTDRRELTRVELRTSNGVLSTKFTQYDGDLRVLERRDQTPDKNERTLLEYDRLYRLAEAKTLDATGTPARHETFSYDGLGNLRTLVDHVGIGDLTITPRRGDRDRICNIMRGRVVVGIPADPNGMTSSLTPNAPSRGPAPTGDPIAPTPESCEYGYDALGNVERINENGRAPRTFAYDGYSRIARLSQSGATAEYKYGPFGEVTELDITGAASAENRRDRRYGPLMEQSVSTSPDVGTTSVLERRIVGPMGVFMARRGNEFIYWHGEDRGNRVFTDAAGVIVQEVDYSSFGRITKNTAAAGNDSYTKYLFNRGDALSTFGVTQMGERVYDLTTGRSLQRDPLLILRTAGKTHPYAFAWNDPFSYTDPSGLNPDDCIGKECTGQALAVIVAASAGLLFHTLFGTGGTGDEPHSAPIPEAGPVAHYHGVGGWTHQNVLEPALRDYAMWRHVGENYASSWGEEVPVLGHVAGYVAGTPHFILGSVGGVAATAMQFVLPKTEEDHFMAFSTLGLGVPIGRAYAGAKRLTGRLSAATGGRPIETAVRAGVQQNKIAGDAFRDEIAALMRQSGPGRDVQTEVYKRAGWVGKRFMDVDVGILGDDFRLILGGIEVKQGSSRYHPWQQLKDYYLWHVRKYPVSVVRDK